VTSPFKHSQQYDHVVEEPKRFAFKGLNLDVVFDSKIVPKLELDHKNLLIVKIEKSFNIRMEICGKKEVDFDFKAKSSSSSFEAIRLIMVHSPP
jgi:hypothetical protein